MNISNLNPKSEGANRNSNFELLRIISMFMILISHANGFTIGLPDKECFDINPISALTRIFFESISIVAVDIFILISGWFSIKYSSKGLLKFLYQTCFIVTIMTLVGWALGEPFMNANILHCVFFSELWFVPVYGCLFIMAPVLNSFAEHASKQQYKSLLIAYFIFQTYVGIIRPGDMPFAHGYSIINFIGLYLLSRYIRLRGKEYIKYGPIIWGLCLLVMVFMLYIDCYYSPNVPIAKNLALAYNSPLVILCALGIIMCFSTMKHNYIPIINRVGASVFAVFPLHIGCTWCMVLFWDVTKYIFNAYSGIMCLTFIAAFLIAIFVSAIVLDQFRIITWNFIQKIMTKGVFSRIAFRLSV